jgi:XTP/dITP diphosphohydrolase
MPESFMSPFQTLVLGTGNRKKGQELIELLRLLPLELRTLADYPSAIVVDETGDSFAANAQLKAAEQARHLGQWVLGEDSGLAVDALGGAPGIYSARYAGSEATDESNNRKLLEQLGNTSLERRTAHYVCHLSLADSEGNIRAEAEARCQGRIRFEGAGTSGFGYDPLFEIPEYHRTFGELGGYVKAALSHRSRAVALLIPKLQALLGSEGRSVRP